MKMSEALERVSRMYAPGCVAYYGNQTPDLWQKMHDELESSLDFSSDEAMSRVCERFVSRAQELVDWYKKNTSPPAAISIADAFHIGNEERLASLQSVRRKECYQCSTRDRIGLEAYGPDALQVRVVCPECKQKSRSA